MAGNTTSFGASSDDVASAVRQAYDYGYIVAWDTILLAAETMEEPAPLGSLNVSKNDENNCDQNTVSVLLHLHK